MIVSSPSTLPIPPWQVPCFPSFFLWGSVPDAFIDWKILTVLFLVRIDNGPSQLLRSEEHTSELQSRQYLVCRLLLEKKKQSIIKKSNLPPLYTHVISFHTPPTIARLSLVEPIKSRADFITPQTGSTDFFRRVILHRH